MVSRSSFHSGLCPYCGGQQRILLPFLHSNALMMIQSIFLKIFQLLVNSSLFVHAFVCLLVYCFLLKHGHTLIRIQNIRTMSKTIFLKEFLYFYYHFLFIYFILFLAALGLRFCARAFSSCGKRGPLFIVVPGPLTIAASLVAQHRLQTHRLSSCGSWAQLLRGMWDLPRPGLEPVSPALAGRLSTTEPARKPEQNY